MNLRNTTGAQDIWLYAAERDYENPDHDEYVKIIEYLDDRLTDALDEIESLKNQSES